MKSFKLFLRAAKCVSVITVAVIVFAGLCTLLMPVQAQSQTSYLDRWFVPRTPNIQSMASDDYIFSKRGGHYYPKKIYFTEYDRRMIGYVELADTCCKYAPLKEYYVPPMFGLVNNQPFKITHTSILMRHEHPYRYWITFPTAGKFCAFNNGTWHVWTPASPLVSPWDIQCRRPFIPDPGAPWLWLSNQNPLRNLFAFKFIIISHVLKGLQYTFIFPSAEVVQAYYPDRSWVWIVTYDQIQQQKILYRMPSMPGSANLTIRWPLPLNIDTTACAGVQPLFRTPVTTPDQMPTQIWIASRAGVNPGKVTILELEPSETANRDHICWTAPGFFKDPVGLAASAVGDPKNPMMIPDVAAWAPFISAMTFNMATPQDSIFRHYVNIPFKVDTISYVKTITQKISSKIKGFCQYPLLVDDQDACVTDRMRTTGALWPQLDFSFAKLDIDIDVRPGTLGGQYFLPMVFHEPGPHVTNGVGYYGAIDRMWLTIPPQTGKGPSQPELNIPGEQDENGTFKLLGEYPNPFNPAMKIEFVLAKPSLVTLKVYNTLGQEVASILDRDQLEEGMQTQEFYAFDLASGVYFYRLIVEELTNDPAAPGQSYINVRKIVLMK